LGKAVIRIEIRRMPEPALVLRCLDGAPAADFFDTVNWAVRQGVVTAGAKVQMLKHYSGLQAARGGEYGYRGARGGRVGASL